MYKITICEKFARFLLRSVTFQLKAVEEMQKTERAAMRELLEEYKNVLSQRDQLLLKQKEYADEVRFYIIQCIILYGTNLERRLFNSFSSVNNLLIPS